MSNVVSDIGNAVGGIVSGIGNAVGSILSSPIADAALIGLAAFATGGIGLAADGSLVGASAAGDAGVVTAGDAAATGGAAASGGAVAGDVAAVGSGGLSALPAGVSSAVGDAASGLGATGAATAGSGVASAGTSAALDTAAAQGAAGMGASASGAGIGSSAAAAGGGSNGLISSLSGYADPAAQTLDGATMSGGTMNALAGTSGGIPAANMAGDVASTVGGSGSPGILSSALNSAGSFIKANPTLTTGAMYLGGGLLQQNATAMQINAQNTWTQQAIQRAAQNQNVGSIQLPTVVNSNNKSVAI